jgi:hypothetical protein
MSNAAAANAAAMATLDAWIARVRALPELGVRAAPDVAEMIGDELRRTIAAGQSPDGTPLKLTTEGEVPLTGAAKALGVAAVGGTVYVRLRGIEAAHHLGRVRAGHARHLIPVGALPPVMVDRVGKILAEHFTDTMTGRVPV